MPAHSILETLARVLGDPEDLCGTLLYSAWSAPGAG